MEPIRICFVCLGNICRSPTAEAIFLDRIAREGLEERFVVDSAGTSGWHVGEPAHPDTRAAARERGIEIRSRGRRFVREDFRRFDLVIAMDRSNQRALERMAGEAEREKIRLFRDYDPASPPGADVPDPYYEGGYGAVFEICEAAADGLLAELRAAHGF